MPVIIPFSAAVLSFYCLLGILVFPSLALLRKYAPNGTHLKNRVVRALANKIQYEIEFPTPNSMHFAQNLYNKQNLSQKIRAGTVDLLYTNAVPNSN